METQKQILEAPIVQQTVGKQEHLEETVLCFQMLSR